ncbi:MAG TPA: molybdopterin oxidoreductase family protein [Moraxellaceae bacterium]|nr:molybdopterin oxidoreductase family protein [Moraxellaceae bacterium]
MKGPEQHFRTCHICEAMCGVVIEHQDGQILSIKGDKQDPLSRGHVCPKVMGLKDVHEDPDRLRRPVKRVGTEFVEISWEEAFATIEANVKRVRREHGPSALGVYVGNPTVHTPALLLIPPFIHALGAHQRFSATSVDQLPHMLANLEMFGHQLLFPVPDLDRTDFLLILGANPAASNGSLMTAGDPMGRIKGIRERGGRVVVVDPRRTETAEKADEHLFIKPGTDFFFLAALAHVMFADAHVRLRHLSDIVTGLCELKAALEPFTPEAVSEMTGIAPHVMRNLARDFASAQRGVCYGRIGTCVQEFGGLASWLLHAINVITGNLDHEGGMMFASPPFNALELGPKGEFGKHRTRVRGLPSFGGEYPASALAEEILTPGKGQIRLLATHAGNPVLSTPNGRQLDEALGQLDFMFSIDIYINETTRHAHIILPPTSALERSHMDLAFAPVSVRNFAKWSPAMVTAPDDSRHDWQILLELSNRLGETGRLGRYVRQGVQGAIERLGLDAGLDLMLRFGPYGSHAKLVQKKSSTTQRVMSVLRPDRDGLSLKKLAENPHGIDLGPLVRRLPAALATADKTIHLAPLVYLADVKRAKERLFSRHAHPMLLIGRRHVRSNNSWLHNSQRLVKGKGRCTAWLHPDDAVRLGVADGHAVRVTSRIGTIELPAEVTDAIMPGVVSVPHGWGHGRDGVQLSVAGRVAGVSVNDITDEQHVDALTGMPVLNGVPVAVSAVTPVEAESAEEGEADALVR